MFIYPPFHGKKAYKPIVHVDEIGLTSDKYVPLNRTLSSLPLKVTIEPMSLQRWQLMQVRASPSSMLRCKSSSLGK